ncbi:MAG: Uncharacterised protein [Cryomorphaceae bacterium]|nr:MAG: Uncharacterised protein [Cryomorphaceae bacterium]
MVALRNRIGEHTNAVVADHTIGFIRCQFPYRQSTPLLVHVQHSVHKLLRALRLRNGIQWMRRTVGVPKTKNGVMAVHGVPVNRIVLTAVGPVDVTPQVRHSIGVVERSCKNGTIVRRSTLHLRFGQFLSPFPLRLFKNLLKRAIRPFSVIVLPSTRLRSPAHSDRHLRLSASLWQGQPVHAGRNLPHRIWCRLHLKTEIKMLLSGPAFRDAASLKFPATQRAKILLEHMVAEI